MHQWSSDKYSSRLKFPNIKQLSYPDACIYNTMLPAGIYEVNGSRQEQYTPTEFTAHKEFICDWDMRYEYIEVLRDTVYNHESLGPTIEQYYYDPDDIRWRSPFGRKRGALPVSVETRILHSYWHYYLPAYAQNIQVAPWGPEGVSYDPTAIHNEDGSIYQETNIQRHTKAKLTVDYKGLARCSSAVLDQTIVPQILYRKLPPYQYTWASDGSQVLDREAPGKQEVKLKITRSLKNIRKIPEVFFSYAGCVNNSLVVDWITKLPFPEGTLLYSPTNLSKTMTSAIGDDDRLWTFTFELNYNPIGWNRFQRPNGVLDTIMFNGAPIELYDAVDFHELGLDDMIAAASEDVDESLVCVNPTAYTSLYEDYYVIWQDTTGYVYLIKVAADGYITIEEVLVEADTEADKDKEDEDPFGF